MRTVLLHPLSGILSAYGIGLAAVRAKHQRTFQANFDEAALAEAEAGLAQLVDEACDELEAQGVERSDIEVDRQAHLRYAGADTTLG